MLNEIETVEPLRTVCGAATRNRNAQAGYQFGRFIDQRKKRKTALTH